MNICDPKRESVRGNGKTQSEVNAENLKYQYVRSIDVEHIRSYLSHCEDIEAYVSRETSIANDVFLKSIGCDKIGSRLVSDFYNNHFTCERIFVHNQKACYGDPHICITFAGRLIKKDGSLGKTVHTKKLRFDIISGKIISE